MENYIITVSGNVYEITVEEDVSTGAAPATRVAAPTPKAAPAAIPKAAPVEATGSVVVPAPIPGKILGMKAIAGQAVKKGDVAIVLEVMRVENEIVAPPDGTVASMNASIDDSIEAGIALVTLN